MQAQYGNEWIDYSKPHFKISVSSEGIYRINASTLNSVGLNFINSNNFQVFRNGQQVALYINKTGANVNYIEFYAYPNDGVFDSTVYKKPEWQLHDKYSLFSDVAVYFLTFNDIGGNKRINDFTNNLTGLPPKEEYFYYSESNIYRSSFSYGKPSYVGNQPLYSSYFDEGEGYIGNGNQQVNNGALSKTFNINTPYKYSSASLSANLKTIVVGWTSNDHHFKIKTGATVINEYQFGDYKLIKSNDAIANNLVSTSTPITIEAIPTSTGTNRNTLALLELEYPRQFNFGNQSFFKFSMQGNGSIQYIEITNFIHDTPY